MPNPLILPGMHWTSKRPPHFQVVIIDIYRPPIPPQPGFTVFPNINLQLTISGEYFSLDEPSFRQDYTPAVSHWSQSCPRP